jgi:hypothetical protein
MLSAADRMSCQPSVGLSQQLEPMSAVRGKHSVEQLQLALDNEASLGCIRMANTNYSQVLE